MNPRRTKALFSFALSVLVLLGVVGDEPRQAVDEVQSRPALEPPELEVNVAPSRVQEGRYYFVAPWRGDHQAGPMILDSQGRVVWFKPVPEGTMAMDFRVQRFRGEPVLTWWEGRFTDDRVGRGEYVIVDSSYQEIARFRVDGGRPGDFHEFSITPDDTALVTIYREVPRDLTPVGGAQDGTVLESIAQEIDIASGRVLLDWHATDHVSLNESHKNVPTDPDQAYDFFHLNSIDIDDDGNLLISARHTDTVYKIDRRTGEVIWRLGGRRSDFDLGPGARFSSQHDARRRPDGTLTLFDNGDPPRVRESSRAITLRLDEKTMDARLVNQREHPEGLLSVSQGNAQRLPNGDFVVGWGSHPYLSRFGPAGQLRFDANFVDPETDLYRAYYARWHGRPTSRPAVAVDEQTGREVVYASWAGATEVTDWQVLAGARPDALRPIASSPWEDLETAIPVDTESDYVAVRALSASGETLGESRTFTFGE